MASRGQGGATFRPLTRLLAAVTSLRRLDIMNPKFLLPVGLVLLALVAALVILAFLDTGVSPSTSAAKPAAAPPATAPKDPTIALASEPASAPPTSITPARSDAPADTITTVDQALTADTANSEPARLAVLEMIDDATTTYSVEGITVLGPMLRHPDYEIREAAIEGMVQLGETSGSKTLREAARRTSDPRQAARMLEAADFLELPEFVGPPVSARP